MQTPVLVPQAVVRFLDEFVRYKFGFFGPQLFADGRRFTGTGRMPVVRAETRIRKSDSESASGWRIIVPLKPGDEEALPRSGMGLSPEGTEPSGFGCPYHFELAAA